MKNLSNDFGLFANVGFALPTCKDSYNFSTWTNFTGTYTYANGDKYGGERKDGKRNVLFNLIFKFKNYVKFVRSYF